MSARDARCAQALSWCLWAAAAGAVCGLAAWADGLSWPAISGLALVGALLAVDLAYQLRRVGRSASPATLLPVPNSSLPQSPAMAATSPRHVIVLRRGPQRFIFSAPRDRRLELVCAIADAAEAGWLDWDEAAALARQLEPSVSV